MALNKNKNKMTHKYLCGKERFKQMPKKEQEAIESLLDREEISIREDISISFGGYRKLDTEKINPNEEDSFIYLGTNDKNITQIKVFNCLRSLGTLPEEFKDLEHLSDLSMDSSSSFMMLANMNLCPTLYRLRLCRVPNVKIFGIEPAPELKGLEIIGCGLKELPDLNYTPNLTYLDIRYNRFRNIPSPDDLKQLKYLKEIDLRDNPLRKVSIHNYANESALKKKGIKILKGGSN